MDPLHLIGALLGQHAPALAHQPPPKPPSRATLLAPRHAREQSALLDHQEREQIELRSRRHDQSPAHRRAHAYAVRQLSRKHADELAALDARQAREVRGEPSPYWRGQPGGLYPRGGAGPEVLSAVPTSHPTSAGPEKRRLRDGYHTMKG
jgi:hypothetical protein